jgi:hypothetical protein
MDKKQTALEWLIGQLQQTRDWQRVINEANQSSTSVRDVIKEAKEMEKERIVKAWMDGVTGDSGHSTAIGYYNETYGGNK